MFFTLLNPDFLDPVFLTSRLHCGSPLPNRTIRPLMDLANKELEVQNLHRAIAIQGTPLGQHSQALQLLQGQNKALVEQVSQLNQPLATFTSPASHASPAAPSPVSPEAHQSTHRDSHATVPEPFSGELGKCRGFLFQCHMMFSQRPNMFSADVSKTQYLMGLLRGRALVGRRLFTLTNLFRAVCFQATLSL